MTRRSPIIFSATADEIHLLVEDVDDPMSDLRIVSIDKESGDITEDITIETLKDAALEVEMSFWGFAANPGNG